MSDNGAPIVSARGLTKHYGPRTVVDGVDLDVFQGEIVGLIGASGAGKTTAVECIQGLRQADSGTLTVFGLDPMSEADKVRPLVGSQSQDSSLPDRLRVGEAVRLFANGGTAAGETLLEEFDLGHLRRSPFANLSGGERQRLFLVLALLNEPRLVILDELSQGLDPAARQNVWAAVERLRRDGRSVLLVTHELTEAEVLCDRVVAMRSGRILDSGTPGQLIQRHGGPTVTTCSSEGMSVRFEDLPGVDAVERVGDLARIVGDRSTIIRVGAALAAQGLYPELSVQVPDLEHALLRLLSEAAEGDAIASDLALAGAPR